MGVLDDIKTAGVVEVPHNHHPAVVQPPQAERTEYPFVGFIDFQGLKVDVENKKGDYRRGKDKDGHEWKCLMHAHYGEIRDTEGVDGDNLDVYVGPNHDSSLVVVVRQHRPDTGAYDEDKVMLGFDSVEEAIGAYKKQYDKPGFYVDGDYLAMPIGRFWRWVHDSRKHGKKVANMKTAAVPDVLRPALHPFAREFALHPTLQKALIGAGGVGAAVVGATKARKYDQSEGEKEEQTGLPSVGRGALRGGAAGATIGAGLGALAGHGVQRRVNQLEQKIVPGVQQLNELMSKLKAEGRTAEEIKNIFQRSRMTENVHGARASIDFLRKAKKVGPGLLAGAGALYGALSGAANRAGAAHARKQNIEELANTVSDTPLGKARVPGFATLLNPNVTREQKERAFARHGQQLTADPEMGVARPALTGAGAGALYGLAAAYPTDVYSRRMREGLNKSLAALGIAGPKYKSMLPGVAAVGAGLGAGTGLLMRHAHNKERAEWEHAQKRGPDAVASTSRKKLREASQWLSGYEPSDSELAHMNEDFARAQKLNVHRSKTAEHVEMPADSDVVAQNLCPVLSHLLALYQTYYFAHWTSRGESSYGDHKLFERLYKSVQKEFDDVAERIIGHCGDGALDGVFSMALSVQEGMGRQGDGPVERALAGEAALRAQIMRAYRSLDEYGGLTLGIDDLLMSIASQHESNCYLLRQRTSPQIHDAVQNAR